MTLTLLIQSVTSLFPSANYSRDYTVSVDAGGNAVIATWNASVGPQPTVQQLNAALDALQLGQAKAAQLALLQAAANAAQSSFTSSALGSVYTYPSQPTDQANLTACVTYSLFPSNPSGWTVLFYCTSSTGVSTYLSHTAAEIQRVGQDAMASIMAAKSKMATLAAEVAAATTTAQVQAVVWG